MDIDGVLKELAAFIEEKVPELESKVTTIYPESNRFESPSVVIDIVSGREHLIIDGAKQYELVRIAIVSDRKSEINRIFKLITDAFLKYGRELTTGIYRGISYVSPVAPAFIEKNGVLKRELDIEIIEFMKVN
jgi:hypothetical protein